MKLRFVLAGLSMATAVALAAACSDDSTSSPADAGADVGTFDGSAPPSGDVDAGSDATTPPLDASVDAAVDARPPPTHVYVTTATGELAVFTTDGDGGLAERAGSPFSTGGSGAYSVLANEDGTRAYVGVVTNSGGAVASFDLDETGDVADAQSGSPISTNVNASPTRVAINAAGTRLYVAHQGATPSIAVFALDASGDVGALRSGSPFGTSTGTYSVSINPAGTRLYVASQEARAVFVFGLDANGDVTGLRAGSPFTTGLTDAPLLSVVHPMGKRLYVTDQDAHVVVYALDANGDITGQTASSPLGGVGVSVGLTMNAAGTRLYVGDGATGKVAVYTLDATTGDVTGATPTLVDIGVVPFDCAIDLAQKHLFVVDTNDAKLSDVTLDSAGDPQSYVTPPYDGGYPTAVYAR